ISPVDIEAARDMGYVIKLLAIAHRREGGVDVRVHPTMIPESHQLATVNGVFNAIYVVGDFVGETMFFGEGAGAGAAASAVMGDVLEVARHIQQGVAPIVGCTCTDELPILPMDELVMRYYLRFSVTDRPGVLETMAGVFARHNISVKSIVQRGRSGAERVDQVVVTHRCSERDIREALEEALSLDNVVLDTPSVIRVEE
ncbi:ACT domain-containing protein, partial [Adlercreutzia caecimuris]